MPDLVGISKESFLITWLILSMCSVTDQVDEVDPEFEKKIRALDVDKSVQNEMIRNARERNKQLQNQIRNLQDMLARRKDRKRPVKLSDEEQQGLSREEQSQLMEARDLQTDSDRKREDQALIDARRLIEKVIILLIY